MSNPPVNPKEAQCAKLLASFDKYALTRCELNQGHDGKHRAAVRGVHLSWAENRSQAILPVHSHGTEEGKGLACRETIVDGKLRGECLASTPSTDTPPNIECCVQCGEPKEPSGQQAGAEVSNGWPRCVNPSCVAFNQPLASALYRPIAPSTDRPQSDAKITLGESDRKVTLTPPDKPLTEEELKHALLDTPFTFDKNRVAATLTPF